MCVGIGVIGRGLGKSCIFPEVCLQKHFKPAFGNVLRQRILSPRRLAGPWIVESRAICSALFCIAAL